MRGFVFILLVLVSLHFVGCRKDYDSSNVKWSINSEKHYLSKDRSQLRKVASSWFQGDSLRVFLWVDEPIPFWLTFAIGNYEGEGTYTSNDFRIISENLIYHSNTSVRENFILDSMQISSIKIEEVKRNKLSGTFDLELVRIYYDTLSGFEPQFDHQLHITDGEFHNVKFK